MATVATNVLIDSLSGRVGKSLVFKTIHGKTFLSACARKPDKKKESEAQRNTRVSFRKATEWAKLILADPERKAYYQQRAKALKLPNAYTAAITDYMRKPRVMKTQHHDTITYRITKRDFAIRQVEVTETHTMQPSKIISRQDRDVWVVHYTPGTNSLSSLTMVITDNQLRETTYRDVPDIW